MLRGRPGIVWPLHLMLLPGVVILFVYHYVPMLGIALAFKQYIPAFGFQRSEWVGLQNFRYLAHLPDIWQVLWNTLWIAGMKIVIGQIVPIVVALLLNEVRRSWLKKGVQTLVYLPHFISWVLLSGVLLDVLSLNGIVNHLLSWLGLERVLFLGDNAYFRYVLVLSDVWKEFGFGTIIYLAALTGINPSLYEAASIDGAGRWKQTWHVTLPGMVPVIVLLATLSLGHVLNAGFDQVFNLYSPSVYQTGDIIDTMIYRIGLQQAQFSVSTALGLFKSAVSLALITISYVLAYRLANYRIF